MSNLKHAENVQIELKALVGVINIIFQLLFKTVSITFRVAVCIDAL